MKSVRILGGLCAIVLCAGAQPFIYYRGVVNAASFEGAGLPAGSIVRGSIFTVFGSGLGPAQYVQPGSYIQSACGSLRQRHAGRQYSRGRSLWGRLR
jgi:hypothetical protein